MKIMFILLVQTDLPPVEKSKLKMSDLKSIITMKALKKKCLNHPHNPHTHRYTHLCNWVFVVSVSIGCLGKTEKGERKLYICLPRSSSINQCQFGNCLRAILSLKEGWHVTSESSQRQRVLDRLKGWIFLQIRGKNVR